MRIEHVEAGGKMTTVLAKEISVGADEVADATRMDVAALRAFYAKEMDACKALGDDVLLSLHLKATMMKVEEHH
jgi:isocitrate dehydrogenase